MSELTGRIIKNYNGYYYVETPDKEIFTCKVKGKLKKNRFSLVTGDIVDFSTGGSEGMISRILPRRNFLQRPLMANIDLVLVFFACANPDLSYLMVDKLLALAEWAKIPAVLCLNKCDLVDEAFIKAVREIYEPVGYPVFALSSVRGTGIEDLRQLLPGKISVLAGPSGVGKSTTLNRLDGSLVLRTGQVSEKIGRGRHTTRYAQLLPFLGGYVADTPGFGNLNLEDFELDNLQELFPEFLRYAEQCRFTGCSHIHEPDCRVKEALAEGAIARSRYESYLSMSEEYKISHERSNKK